MLLVSPRFVYLVTGICSLYLSIAPFLSRWHGPISFFTLGFWIGAVLLLMAAVLPPSGRSTILALFGSAFVTALLVYGIGRFAAFRMGFIHGSVQVIAYQPTTLDHLMRMLNMPVMVALLISSLASLLISALMTMHLRNRGHSQR